MQFITLLKSKMNDLISVIVPVYKVEEYLDECVKSIISQSYSNLEIILVDDGSPDKCPELCDLWATKDNRIKVVHKCNGGLSSARNAGLDIACGDYISFVDSDDYIAPDMIANLYNCIIEHKTDISACKIYSVTNNNILEYDKKGNEIKDKTKVISAFDYLKLYIGGKIENASWNKLYRRDCFEKIRFREGRNNEDFLMFYELCKIISSISFVDYFGYYYRQREGSIVHDKKKYLYFDIIDNIEEIKEDIKKNLPQLIEDIEKKEIQERIIFLKKVLKNHDVIRFRKEFVKNERILQSLPLSFRYKLPVNFHRPFLILRFFPFIYLFKS